MTKSGSGNLGRSTLFPKRPANSGKHTSPIKGQTFIVTVHGIRIDFYRLSFDKYLSEQPRTLLTGSSKLFKYAYAISQHHATSADNSWRNSLNNLKVKELLQLLHGVFGTIDRVTDRARVRVDLIIVATGEALVTEEVDGLVLDAGDVLLGLDVLQAVSLVPTGGEDIERDLATDGVAVCCRTMVRIIGSRYTSFCWRKLT